MAGTGRLLGIPGLSCRLPALTAASLLSLGLSAFPAAAQEGALAVEQEGRRICHVVAGADADGDEQEVNALCWGTGLALGRADQFQSHANPGLEATIVELERDGEKRVLLLRPDAQGWPLLEDIGGMLAVSAGRSPWSGLEDLALDYGRFADSGRLAVRSTETGEPGDGRQLSAIEGQGAELGMVEVRIDEHIALDEQRLAAAAQ